MARLKRLPLVLTSVVALAAASCGQLGPLAMPPAPGPGLETTTAPDTLASARGLVPEDSLAPRPGAVTPPQPPVAVASMPGDKVTWYLAPARRTPPAGVGAFLADVESRLPPEMGTRYRDKSRVTWCHETTHGVHSALRNSYRSPAFYPGGGKFALVEPPAVTLGEVAAVVPPRLRGTRYQLYMVNQRREWDRDPLYVWDEWVAYDNGTTAGIEEGGSPGPGTSDDAVSCIELSGYALAVAAAARRKGLPVSEQFREFLAWELRRSLGLYIKAVKLPAFAWYDRRLEQAWRGGDPFVVEELRALYGDALTVRDLLP